MVAHPLSESFEVSGEWFIPENPERLIAGRLHYTPERTELHLNEALQPLRGDIRRDDGLQSYAIVYGTTTKGDAMTLLKTQQVGGVFQFRVVPRRWIDTRKYYTHWDEELRTNVLDGQGMYDANVRMRHFVRVLYLELMGIPQEAVLRPLCNSSDSSQLLAQLNAAERRRVDPNDTSGVIMTIMEKTVEDIDESDLPSAPPSDQAGLA